MTKFQDWASEREFRLLAFTANRPELPIGEAFSGIVLGQSFPQAEEKVLGSRLFRLGVGDTMVAKMSWDGGMIGVYPMGHGLPNLEWPGTEGINGLVRPIPDSVPSQQRD